VNDLLPNLEALLDALLDDTPAGRDANELSRAAAHAGSWEDVDDALDHVVAGWTDS
jgi:hypothetical protein